jgi:hypothetical protein
LTCLIGVFSEINQLAPPAKWGQMNSLYFVIIYLFFAVATIVPGFGVTHFGLYEAIVTFAVVLTIFTLLEIIWLLLRQKSADSPGKSMITNN